MLNLDLKIHRQVEVYAAIQVSMKLIILSWIKLQGVGNQLPLHQHGRQVGEHTERFDTSDPSLTIYWFSSLNYLLLFLYISKNSSLDEAHKRTGLDYLRSLVCKCIVFLVRYFPHVLPETAQRRTFFFYFILPINFSCSKSFFEGEIWLSM